MKYLTAILLIFTLGSIGPSAHADPVSADCWSPVINQPLDFDILGPRALLTGFNLLPNGTYAPVTLPIWVSAIPHTGQLDEGDKFQVLKLGQNSGEKENSSETTSAAFSPTYVLQIRTKDGELSPIVASGSRTGDLSGEGTVSVRKVLDVFGKAQTGANFITTTTGADLQLIRIPLGNSGVVLVGVTRTAFQIQSSGNSLTGSLQPGGGLALEVPTSSKGESLRIGIIAGPNFNLGGPADKFVSPAISTGAQLLAF